MSRKELSPPAISDIPTNLGGLTRRIDDACSQAGRLPEAVTLIGASKTQNPEQIRAAFRAGVHDFGENYLDEALPKITELEDLDARWHFIGRIQSNKTRSIAECFDWVHTIERLKIAQRLNDQCPKGKILQVLLQVNIDADPHKAGLQPEACRGLLAQMFSMPNLAPRGLMTILAKDHNPAVSFRSMAELHQSLAAVVPSGYSRWDSLSMGMTADLEDAIAAGATHVRIGTALFGARNG